MIDHPGTVLKKFRLCKELGYQGIELISPTQGLSSIDVRDTSEQTSMPVHGVVDMKQ